MFFNFCCDSVPCFCGRRILGKSEDRKGDGGGFCQYHRRSGVTSVFIAGKISAPGKAMTILGIAVGFLAACFLESGKGYKRSMIFSAAGLIISILPVVQFIIQFQGLAVKISGDFILILAVGVLLNTGVFIASWKKRNK